jgi:hypothetical protein
MTRRAISGRLYLTERGAERVVAFDIAPKPADAADDPRIVWMQGAVRYAGHRVETWMRLVPALVSKPI